MANPLTDEARPATTHTTEAKSTLAKTWNDMTSVRWQDLTAVKWSDLSLIAILKDEDRPATTHTAEARP